MKNRAIALSVCLLVFCSSIATAITEKNDTRDNNLDTNNSENIAGPPLVVNSLTVYPGDILSVTYPLVVEEIPEFYFGRKRLAALAEGKQWRIFIGTATDMIPGRYVITVTQPDKSNEKVEFVVKPSRNTLSTTQKVNRSSNFILNRLQSRKKKSLSKFKLPDLPWANLTPIFPIDYPAKGQWSKNFGELQVTNGNDLMRLNYIQLVTTEPQPILSPTDAICLEITEKEGTYSIWLDHGMGLFSHISGLQNTTIEEQDKIVSGSMISNIIDSKTAAPQTIQWRMLFNGVLVNPHSAVALKKPQ